MKEYMYRPQVCKNLQNLVDYNDGLIYSSESGPGIDPEFGAQPLDEAGINLAYCPFCGSKIKSDWDGATKMFKWWEE
jgi:hypothetical protein